MNIEFNVSEQEESYLNNFNDFFFNRLIEKAKIDEFLYHIKIIDANKYHNPQTNGYIYSVDYDLMTTPIYYQLAETNERLQIGL